MIELRYRLKTLCEYEQSIEKVLKIYGLREETVKDLQRVLKKIKTAKENLLSNSEGVLV